MSGARSQRPPPLLCFLFLPATIARLVSPSPAALPSFLPARAAEIREPEAVEAMSRMRMLPVVVDTANLCATVGTCFYEIPARSPTPRERFDGLDVQLSQRMAQARLVQSQLRPPAASAAGATMPVLCLHGADASSLEWRRALPRLARLGLTGAAVDWWSGGFTDRRPILTRLGAAPAADKRPYPADQPASRAAPSTEQPLQPWTLVRDHLHAFCRQRYGDQPIILVGASLGGAVALDFACAHPDAVGGLVLCDAGGESYASPPAPVVAALAPAVAGAKVLLELAGRGVLSASWAGAVGQGAAEELRINSVHRDAPGWAEALGSYFASGGYQARVGPPLIRRVRQPSLVVWGSDDPVLPMRDAYAFERDLPGCVGVRLVPGAGHTPQLEDPDAVALLIAQFARELGA